MINLKSKKEIETMAAGGKILAGVLEEGRRAAKEGMSLLELDALASQLIKKSGAEPAFLGYRPEGADKPYPATICASVNEVVVHGVPTKYVLKKGDVLKIDVGLGYGGLFVDTATTVMIEPVTEMARRLVKATEESLGIAMREAKPGRHLEDIGFAVNKFVSRNRFKVVRSLTGHGIGKEFHEEPVIYNFGVKGRGPVLAPGMVMAIEPIISAGSDKIIQLKDESYATADGSISAHFEHTVAITEKGPVILTA